MAQKITLSVPDMLYESIKQWRDSFNLSKMFQDVMTDAIHRKEEFQKRFQQEFDLPEIIQRLKLEKIASEKKYYDIGKSEGLKWAKTAHYEDLVHALGFDNALELTADSSFCSYFKNIFSQTGLARYTIMHAGDHETLFVQGWMKSIRQFWDQVKESL